MITMSVWKENKVQSPYAPRFQKQEILSSIDSFYQNYPAESWEVITAEYTPFDLRLYVREKRF